MTFHSFLFQLLDNTKPTDITYYRVFIGWADTTTKAAKKLQLRSRSTTLELMNIDDAGTPRYTYGARALTYQGGKVWFGGAREKHEGGLTGFRPLIGRVSATTLALEEAHYWDPTPDGTVEYTMVDVLYTSGNSANHMMVGLGVPRDSSYTLISSNKILLIIGVDETASTAWTSVGCWKWSTYIMNEATAYFRKIDDIVGPIDDGTGVQTLYIWMRQWNTLADLLTDTQRETDFEDTWEGVRQYKIQNFHNTIVCTNGVDALSVGGTAVTARGTTFETRTSGYDCLCNSVNVCRYATNPPWSGCPCSGTPYQCSPWYEQHLPQVRRIMSTSRTLPSFVIAASTPRFDGKALPNLGAKSIVVFKAKATI